MNTHEASIAQMALSPGSGKVCSYTGLQSKLSDCSWPLLKWSHSIITEADFLDEWSAQCSAFQLSFELFGPDFAISKVENFDGPKDMHHDRKSNTVSFAPDVQLLLGSEDSFDFLQLQIPAESLAMQDKPWSLIKSPIQPASDAITCIDEFGSNCDTVCRYSCEDSRPAHIYASSFDSKSRDVMHLDLNAKMPERYSLHATVDHIFDQKRSLLVAQGLHEDVDQKNNFSVGESYFVSSVVVSAKKKPFDHEMSQIRVSHLQFVQDPILSESCPHDYLSPPRHPLYRVASSSQTSLLQSETQGFDKHEDVCKVTSVFHSYLHAQQTLSPDSCYHTSEHCPSSSTTAVLFHGDDLSHIPFPGQFAQSRRDFESPIERHDQFGQRQIEQEDEQDITDFDNQELPAFVDDLTQHFLSLNFDVYDADFEIPVRTWYIDHATIRRWTAPRILQLTGPPDSWGGQIVALWIDQINTEAWFDISVVQPDPPRTLRYAYVMFDLIVTQTFSLERYAGLATVIPDQVGSFELFSVACSFEQYVSGIDVVLAADASSYCRYQACRITQRWEELPYNFRPQHAMANGDSFHITVRNAPPILAQPASSSSGASSSTDRPPQSHVSSSVEPPGRMNQFMTPLHLFQLQGHEVITQLVNAQLVQPSHEIAHALNVPFHALEALHLVPVRPADMSEMTIAAVVQRTGDIPQRSTDRLLLMDVIYHLHPAPEGRTNHPRIVRTVERVGHLVTRNQLLLTAVVFHYCAFLNDVCTVHLDEVLWLFDDRNVRPIRHGSYARIDLPPPAEFPVDTQTAANSVLEAQTELTQDYFFPPSDPDDDVNLMQKAEFHGATQTASSLH